MLLNHGNVLLEIHYVIKCEKKEAIKNDETDNGGHAECIILSNVSYYQCEQAIMYISIVTNDIMSCISFKKYNIIPDNSFYYTFGVVLKP